MITKEAIEKAIEGGWEWKSGLGFPRNVSAAPSEMTALTGPLWWQVALTPSFWQSLGKALGWGLVCDGCEANYDGRNPRYCFCEGNPFWEPRYMKEAMTLYRLLLKEKPTDKFWHELLSPQSPSLWREK